MEIDELIQIRLVRCLSTRLSLFKFHKQEENMKFTDLDIQPEILSAVEKMGFEEMSPIQEKTIPIALQGEDLIGQAQTGTGKTAAFGIPTIQKIDINNPNVQALVVAPTRELAIQTQEEIFRLGRDKGVKVQSVYGGADIRRQVKMLSKKPHIIVGTPGRLIDHLNRKNIKLDGLEVLVLDEADEMLNMGFIDDIKKIINQTPDSRQTLLFSATMPKEIQNIATRFMKDPDVVKIKAQTVTAKNVDQYFTRASEAEKFDYLTRFIDMQNPELAIIFGRTKRRVDELSRGLTRRGYNAEGIHGDLSQHQRMNVLRRFKEGSLDILVATDVAARGLDISGVTHVYNYDIPQDPESYVHRIGRTGRAGKEGQSITFVTNNEMDYLRTIETLTKQKITPLKPPTDEEALRGQVQAAHSEIADIVAEVDQSKHAQAIEKLVNEYTPEELAGALLKVTVKEPSDIPVRITPERPLPNRNRKRSNKGKGHYKKRGQSNHRGRGGRNNNKRRNQGRKS